jgi:FlaA1/EpsC-like NDP-sugar epimerase
MTQNSTIIEARPILGCPDELAFLATGRNQPLFSEDVARFRGLLSEQIAGVRVLVIGGAGSIGSATVKALIPFQPDCLHIVDQNENGLAELVRDVRSRFEAGQLPDFRTVPLNFGSPIMERFLAGEPPYDYILNFAALKHVRSEKDSYSILQMLDTNVLKPLHLLRWAMARGGLRGYFSVSTDKAANPVNVMGASKRLMEHAIFSFAPSGAGKLRVASARFANVAFSDGSLLQGWLMRLAKGQPVAVPRDTRRYFVSLEEAGQICLLAAFLAPDRHLLVPRLDAEKDMLLLSDLAIKVLVHYGYKAEFFEDEGQARQAAAARRDKERHPLLLTPLNTAGEKPYEEFVGVGEREVDVGMGHLAGVPYVAVPKEKLSALMENLESWINCPQKPVESPMLVEAVQSVLPEFHHLAGVAGLDQRL